MKLESKTGPDTEAIVTLNENSLSTDPLILVDQWLDEARKCSGIIDYNAMCLSTIGVDGYPDSRMVLLRQFDAAGFVFFSNATSAKGKALTHTPRAALNFFWDPLRRQLRVRGDVSLLSPEATDEYFHSRPRRSQLGAWASEQSAPLPSREVLETRIEQLEYEWKDMEIARPDYWIGYRVIPNQIEFWQERENRLHDRFQYRKLGDGWITSRLYP